MATSTTKIPYIEGSAPATPATGEVVTYAKADGLMYSKDDAGTETLMSGGAGGGGSVATDTIWDAAGDLVQGTGADTAARLAIGASGTFLQSTGSAAAWHAPKIPVAFYRRTAGDYTLNNTSWTDVDATNMNLTIPAVAGDILEILLSTRMGSVGGEAVNAFLDVATIVSASPVNYVSGGTGAAGDLGIAGWLGVASASVSVGGPAYYTVQAGDISGGNVVVRLRYRTSAATNKTMRAGTAQNDALFFAVKNLGH